MITLIFKNEKLLSVLRISEQASEFRCTFPEAVKAYESETRKKYTAGINLNPYIIRTSPTLWLVKDTGVYLMTPAKLDKMPEDDSHLCFAIGFAPTDEDWFDKSAAVLGGEDFVESFEFTDGVKKAIRLGCDMHIKISESEYIVEMVVPEK
jgi:hypothetical protein